METGVMDERVDYSRQVAHARAVALQGEAMRTKAVERAGPESFE